MTLYIFATVKITDWRTGLRRDMVNKSREEYAIKNDSISNYETVKVSPAPIRSEKSTSMLKNTSSNDIEMLCGHTKAPRRKL
jgi:ABC-type transport system involved in Fe-S cluster assembly fused permease/ATPase subunit